jgi:hypothetical protein
MPASEHLIDRSPPSYQVAVNRVDQQFQSLIDSLQRNGRLENAIVVILSDHGEGFSTYSTPWQPVDTKHILQIPPYSWHGLNVLDEHQISVVLAIRTFGSFFSKENDFDRGLASLVDVAPTVVDMLKLPSEELNMSGCAINVKNLLPSCTEGRIVFTESGFYVDALLVKDAFDEKAVAYEAQKYYETDELGRLTIKNEFIHELLSKKQRAAISENWVFAYVPFQGQEQFLVGDIRNQRYWNARLDTWWMANSKVRKVFESFCGVYSRDNLEVNSFCDYHAALESP